jgi:hypothetical protein
MTRQKARGKRQGGRGFEVNLLFFTYFGFFPPFYLVGIVIYYRKNIVIAINIIILIFVIRKVLEIYLKNILLILV